MAETASSLKRAHFHFLLILCSKASLHGFTLFLLARTDMFKLPCYYSNLEN